MWIHNRGIFIVWIHNKGILVVPEEEEEEEEEELVGRGWELVRPG